MEEVKRRLRAVLAEAHQYLDDALSIDLEEQTEEKETFRRYMALFRGKVEVATELFYIVFPEERP